MSTRSIARRYDTVSHSGPITMAIRYNWRSMPVGLLIVKGCTTLWACALTMGPMISILHGLHRGHLRWLYSTRLLMTTNFILIRWSLTRACLIILEVEWQMMMMSGYLPWVNVILLYIRYFTRQQLLVATSEMIRFTFFVYYYVIML